MIKVCLATCTALSVYKANKTQNLTSRVILALSQDISFCISITNFIVFTVCLAWTPSLSLIDMVNNLVCLWLDSKPYVIMLVLDEFL